MRALLLIIALLLHTPPAAAQEVNLRNANLYYEAHDVRVQRPGAALELQRVYNSRSNLVGYFGYGWSTNLDVLCQEGPDGSVLITDADGFIMRYTPHGEPRERLMERYVDRLVDARRDQDARAGSPRSDAFYEDLRQQLIDTPELRQELGMALPDAWLDAAPGEYISYDRGTERLTKNTDGSYVRYRADGTQYHFSTRGLLTKILDPGGRGIRLDYDRDGKLIKVSHTEGGSITLSYSPDGLVASILDTEGRRITYSYDGEHNLLRVEGPGSRQLAYSYDDEHNLVAARLADGSGFQVSYDVERDWVHALKRGEEVTQYRWVVDDDQHYTCEVTGPDGAVTRTSFDDAENRRTVERPDGTREETLLSACCSKPLEVRDEDGVTRYDYDQQARLVGIVYPDGGEVRYAYHPKWARVVQAMHSDGRRYSYTYDEVGNLVQASDGRRELSLRYGGNGKVQEIRDRDGATYTFVYDASGRPTSISAGGGASLNSFYGINGEIRSSGVVGGSGSDQALFDELREVLSLLEPATGSMQ